MFLRLFLTWGFLIRSLVYAVELPAFLGIQENLGSFLDAFEKGVVFAGASGGALVGMVAEDFFAVGGADLGFGGVVAMFGEAKYSVMVLTLKN